MPILAVELLPPVELVASTGAGPRGACSPPSLLNTCRGMGCVVPRGNPTVFLLACGAIRGPWVIFCLPLLPAVRVSVSHALLLETNWLI